MKREALLNKLTNINIFSKESYADEAFSRNIGLLTQEEQDKLSEIKIGIPGLGGVGGVHLITMARTGFGKFHISDYDTFEAANVNRQFGATVPSFDLPKLKVMKDIALSINPFIEIKEFPEGLNERNIDQFIEGVDVILDSIDYFEFETRRYLFNRAQEKGTYVITAGPMGFSSAMLIFSPHDGMTFDEYFNITKDMDMTDKYISFGIGLAPRPTHFKYVDFSKVDLDNKSGPSLNIACQICSAMAATETLRIVLNRGKIKPVPYYTQFDPYARKYVSGKLSMGNRHPVQKLKIKIAKTLIEKKRASYRTPHEKAPQNKPTPDSIPDNIFQYLIKAAIQAPSGDNAQPWKFSYEGNKIHVYLDREKDQSFFNVEQTASIISCGAAIENITVAAKSLHLEADITLLPSDGKDNLMATIRFTYTDHCDAILLKHIWKRQTNRRFFEKKSISNPVINQLSKVIENFENIKLHFINDASGMNKVAEMIFDVDRIRSEFKPLHEHLHQMIRYTKEDAEEKRDGLPLKNLEAGLPGETILKLTKPWSVMNIANKAGLGKMIAHISKQGILNSGGVALLTAPGTDTKDYLNGGMALERIWLTLARKGIFLQPMTAVTLFWNRWNKEGKKNFLDTHQARLPQIWENYKNIFPDVDFEKEGHIMLFRIGYGKEIRFNTYRKDINEFLI